ncbi:MAG: GNAT family N-acetyltransferase [Bacteroidia bacterium]
MKAISCPQVTFSLPSCIFTPQVFDTTSDTTSTVQTRVFHSIGDVPVYEINNMLSPDLLALLTGTEAAQMPGMSFKYVLSTQAGMPAVFAYFQLLSFSASQIRSFTPRPENADDLYGKLRNVAARIAKNILEKRQIHILVSGNALITGQSGIFHAPSLSPEDAYRQLPGMIERLLAENPGIDAVLLKDHLNLPEAIAGEWAAQGYQPFATEPDMGMPVIWETVDDYHLDMASKYRQRVKSAYKKSNGTIRRELTEHEVIKYKNRLFELFDSVLKEDRFNLVPHSTEYLPAMKAALGEKFRIYGYFSAGEIVAFQTLIEMGEDLYCHFLGYHCELNREYKLYQRMLYDAVAMAIDGRFKRISFGRTAMEIKSTVGATPAYPVCYLKFSRPVINRLAAPYLRNVKIEDWQPRHPFKSMIPA